MSLLTIYAPSTRKNAHQYIIHTIFDDFLGIDYSLEYTDSNQIFIKLPNEEYIKLPSILLTIPEELWLKDDSLPTLPLKTIEGTYIPILYGDDEINKEENDVTINADIFGSAFFMLSRYEELTPNQPKDKHGRPIASHSIAEKENFLHRPIVDEYADFLFEQLQSLYPSLKRKERDFKITPTHDIDVMAYHETQKPLKVFLSTTKLALLKASPSKAYNHLKKWWSSYRGSYECDPFNTFDWLMDENEKNNTISEFYFKVGATSKKHDVDFDISKPRYSSILKKIHDRGHQIGIHPSYETYRDLNIISSELDLLKETLKTNKINQHQIGGRHHYLRWDSSVTPVIWNELNLSYDSSLMYPQKIGFRCGTCHEYPIYNFATDQALSLRERPLLVMDVTLFDYMKLSPAEAIKQVKSIKEQCQKHKGNFIFLWHNSYLQEPWQREFYKKIFNC